MTFTQTSFNYLQPRPEHLGDNLDRDLKMIFSSHATLDAAVIKAPNFGGGYAMANGRNAVTGSVTIPTGLATVTNVVASLDGGHGVALNLWVTADAAQTPAGSIELFVWQPTSSTVNTPIAGTSAVTVNWVAFGTAATTTS